MKAKDVKIGTKVITKRHCFAGIIVANKLRMGDECVVVEWDGSMGPSSADSVSAYNINDLKIVKRK